MPTPKTTAKKRAVWQAELHESILLSRSASDRLPLATDERHAAQVMDERFPVLLSPRYQRLIDWNDPLDPIRKLVLPTPSEFSNEGRLDTSGEFESTVVQGLQHKYRQTAVILMTQACAAHCRYCFRRRLLSHDAFSNERISDLAPALAYIAAHPEIDNVLLSGGDPLIASTGRIGRLLDALAAIPHLRQIRVSTKIPAALPSRILSEPEFLSKVEAFRPRFHFVFQCHFDHPRELDEESRRCLKALRETGALLTSQIALMPGINADSETLAELFRMLALESVVPQYVFHPRPVKHATHFQLPLAEGLRITDEAKAAVAGPARRARYVLADEAGKAEIIGEACVDEKRYLILKWHQRRMGRELDNPVELYGIKGDECWLREA